MGKLRSAMGALGLVVESVPELISRLDQFAEKIEEARFGTVAAVQLQPETGELCYSLAGHPPPLVIDPEGKAEFLEGGAGLPLCIALDDGNGTARGPRVPGGGLDADPLHRRPDRAEGRSRSTAAWSG